MADPFRFRMKPQDDLSTRADFGYDIMQQLSKVVEEAVESSDVVAKLKTRARVDVTLRGSLNSLEISIQIAKLGDEEIPQNELADAKQGILRKIDETVKAQLSNALQSAMASARARL